MSSLLKNLNTDESVQHEADTLGGMSVLESGIYVMKVQIAYLTKSKGGALCLNLGLVTDTNQEVRQRLWVTSGDAKGNKTYYERNGERRGLPGFLHADSLCLLTVGKSFSDMDTEEKLVPVYSPDAKAEVPTKVEVLVELLNQEIIVGMIKQTVDVNTYHDGTKSYVPTGETRDENEIDKLFRAKDSLTVAEILGSSEEAVFIESWRAKNTGVTRNRAKGSSGQQNTGSSKSGTTVNKPTTSLFK